MEGLGFPLGPRGELAPEVESAAVQGESFRPMAAPEGGLAQAIQDVGGRQALGSLALEDRQRLPQQPLRLGEIAG